MNIRIRSLQLHAQQICMPHITRMQEDILMYNLFSIDEKYLHEYGNFYKIVVVWKFLLQMVYPYANGFTCRKHNGNSAIDYMLLFGSYT